MLELISPLVAARRLYCNLCTNLPSSFFACTQKRSTKKEQVKEDLLNKKKFPRKLSLKGFKLSAFLQLLRKKLDSQSIFFGWNVTPFSSVLKQTLQTKKIFQHNNVFMGPFQLFSHTKKTFQTHTNVSVKLKSKYL